MVFGRKRGPDSTLDLQILVYPEPSTRAGYPCLITGQGDASMIPYLPAVYLDKILANLRSDKIGAELLLESVDAHLNVLCSAIGANREGSTVPFDYYARSRQTVIVEEAPSSARKPGRITTNFYINHRKKRFGAITHLKDGTANPESAETGFWAVWNWGCSRYEPNNWVGMAKQTAVLVETMATYRRERIVTPSMTNIGKVPYRVCADFESAEAVATSGD